MKILYSYGGLNKKNIRNQTEKLNEAGYDIKLIDHREEIGIDKWTHTDIYNRLKNYNKDNGLLKLYKKIRELSEDYDVLIVNHENPYSPKFIQSLNLYTVIVSGDDPESSDYCSKPYVHAFDHAFSWGINFDKKTRITEKFMEWGAKRADWWPYGATLDMYDPFFRENDIFTKERDIDIIFVGNPWLKLERLSTLKRAFSNQIQIFGRNYLKYVGFNCLRDLKKGNINSAFNIILSGLWGTKEIPNNQLNSFYRRSKIGINIHLSYGPCNTRLYHLPANGVMQICDCKDGLGEVFEIGKEVVVFDSIEEAIELTKYYLEHDEERKKIASAGFKRVMKDYQRIITFSKAIEKIKSGMLEDGIRYSKDGTPIIDKHNRQSK